MQGRGRNSILVNAFAQIDLSSATPGVLAAQQGQCT
jgi:hypothetical protein